MPSDIPGGRVIKTEIYDRNSLWGYINGGADLYLEYGFIRLTAQEIFINPSTYKINIYEMSSPESAFGIFSVSHRKCRPADSLSDFNCLSPYHLQIVWGSYYLSIINANGTSEEQNVSKKIASILTSKLKRKILSLPSLCKIPLLSPLIKDMKFIMGRLGLENGLPSWTNKFDELRSYSFFHLQGETNDGIADIFQIKIEDEKDRVRLFSNLGIPIPATGKTSKSFKGGATMWCGRISDELFIYLESSMKREDTDIHITALSGLL